MKREPRTLRTERNPAIFIRTTQPIPLQTLKSCPNNRLPGTIDSNQRHQTRFEDKASPGIWTLADVTTCKHLSVLNANQIGLELRDLVI
jgi:hypothetical protein